MKKGVAASLKENAEFQPYASQLAEEEQEGHNGVARICDSLITALLFGALIGAERQWRQRMARLRTNALVAAGAAMFVMMGGLIAGEGSQGRVAAYVVSGIGFLGGGVILKDGLSIRGQNTAATLWCTAAIGTLSGLGATRFALVGTLGVIGANILQPPVGKVINRGTAASDAEITYLFRITTRVDQESHMKALLLQPIGGQPTAAAFAENRGSRTHRQSRGLRDSDEHWLAEPTVGTAPEPVESRARSDGCELGNCWGSTNRKAGQILEGHLGNDGTPGPDLGGRSSRAVRNGSHVPFWGPALSFSLCLVRRIGGKGVSCGNPRIYAWRSGAFGGTLKLAGMNR